MKRRNSLLLALATLALPVVASAALTSTVTALEASTVTKDGSLGTNEYGTGNAQKFAGAGTGFGGVLNGDSLYVANDNTNLYLALDPNADLNDIAVIYLNTRAGGFTDADMDDTGDNGRRVTSNLGIFGDDTMPAMSSAPDFAVVVGNFGTVLFELKAGTIDFVAFDGTFTGNSPTTVREVVIPWASLETPGSAPVDVEMFVAYGAAGWLSNESIPASATLNAGLNPGDSATATYENHVKYVAATGFTGSGNYTVGTGGAYPTLGAFFREMTGYSHGTGTLALAPAAGTLTTAASTTITGVGTSFLSTVAAGDILVVGTSRYVVATVVSDNSLTVLGSNLTVASGLSYSIIKATEQAVPAGTATLVAGANVTGVGTSFTTFQNGDVIVFSGGQTRAVAGSPLSDTVLTVNANTTAATSQTMRLFRPNAAAGVNLAGTGTLFTTEAMVGGSVFLNDQIGTITAINSNTSLTVTGLGSAASFTSTGFWLRDTPPPAVSGNVTVHILSDLTEPNNVPIFADMGANTLTIKPASTNAGTVTVNLTRAEDNAGFSGNIMVGQLGVSFNALAPNGTDNVVFDGSKNGTTSRDMILRNSASHSFSAVANVAGDCDNVVFKNLIIRNDGTSTGSSTSGLVFQTRILTNSIGGPFATAGNYVPDTWQVLNNEIDADLPVANDQGHGIRTALSQGIGGTTPASGVDQDGFIISGNEITAGIRGIFFDAGSMGTVTNNKIVTLGTGVTGLDLWGIFVNNGRSPAAGTAEYSGNQIEVRSAATAAVGANGIALLTAGTGLDRIYNVRNNTVVLSHTGTGAASSVTTGVNVAPMRGIRGTSGVTYNVQHNSVYIPAASGLTGTTAEWVYGIGTVTPNVASTWNIQNNLLWVEEAGGVGILAQTPASGLVTLTSNDNAFSVGGGAVPVSRVTYSTLPRAGSSQTANNTGQLEATGTTRIIRLGNASATVATVPYAVGQFVKVDCSTGDAAGTIAAFEGEVFQITSVVANTASTPTVITLSATASATLAATLVPNGNTRVMIVGDSTTGASTPAVEFEGPLATVQAETSPAIETTSAAAAVAAGTVSPVDLHLIAAPGADFVAAAPVAGITTDIDGATRGGSPNRGADEYAANTAPTAINGTAVASVAENNASATLVTAVSAVDSDVLDLGAISATASAGTVAVTRTSPDEYSIALTAALNFETNPTVDITVTATDRANATFQRVFTIPVTNVNEAPTGVNLTANTIAENAGVVIGTLSAVDPDAGNTHTFALGGADAAAFQITGGNQLELLAAANFEVKASYAITVTATDQGTLASSAVPFTILVTDVNEAPTDIALSNATINEGVGNIAVGTLSATDVDAGASATFALVSGTGDTDNSKFSITGNALSSNGTIRAGNYSIRVEATDNGTPGLTFQKELAITVNDVADTDGDGIADAVEGSPNDALPGTASFVSTVGAQAVTLTSTAGTLSGVTSIATPGSEPGGTTFPIGLVDFSITGLTNGQTVTVTIDYPSNPAINKAYKVNGTTYTEIAGATVSATSISYSITDGGVGDADGVANGVIDDPAGPAVFVSSVSDWTILND